MFRQNGFTLLEVLVALVILGLALMFLNSTVSNSLLRADRIEDEDRAVTLADNVLASLGRDLPLRTGTFEGKEGNLTWRLVVSPEMGQSTVIPLDQVDLIIASSSHRLIGHWQTLRVAAQLHVP